MISWGETSLSLFPEDERNRFQDGFVFASDVCMALFCLRFQFRDGGRTEVASEETTRQGAVFRSRQELSKGTCLERVKPNEDGFHKSGAVHWL